jgi:hypothetical protein
MYWVTPLIALYMYRVLRAIYGYVNKIPSHPTCLVLVPAKEKTILLEVMCSLSSLKIYKCLNNILLRLTRDVNVIQLISI